MSELDDAGRLAVVDGVLAFLKQSSDPRAPDAAAHYQAQREELARRIQATNPPPVTIQVNVARLGAQGG